jgi:uncharacterized protein with ParB-like and HNH nuclease domain
MSFQTPITIFETIENIENKRFLLPAIQREFEWEHKKIEWLFDSIMRNYPISSFLFWRVEGKTKTSYKFYSLLQNYRERYNTHNEEVNTSVINDFTAILDGQQRLGSLYLGLKGSYAYKEPRVWWENTEYAIPTRHLYLNIENPLKDEEDGRIYDFKFLTNKDYNENPSKWFKVGDILAFRDLKSFNKFLDEHDYKKNEFTYDTLSTLQKAIHSDQIINYFLEKEQDIDKALNIFIRINSGGEPLNFSDLLMSIAVANWIKKDAKKEINRLVDEIRDKGFFITKDFILKAYLLLFSTDIRFKVTNFSKENAANFESEWEKIYLAIHRTFDLLKEFGFIESTLTSKNALLPIVYYLYHRNVADSFPKKKEFEADREIVKKWLHIVLIKRIFGGQADQILAKIRTVFTEDINEKFLKSDFKKYPFIEIQSLLRGTTKDMTLDDEYIENLLKTQKENSLAFSILALMYPSLDYKNGNFHKDHIHASSLFKRKILNEKHIKTEIHDFYLNPDNFNSILNLQLLDANENKSKQDKDLKEWVQFESKKQKINIEKFCENHLIPNILEFEKFDAFINERKKLLMQKLKEIVN